METPKPPVESPGQIAVRALARADRFLDAAMRELPSVAEHMRRGELAAIRISLDHLLDGLGSLARLTIDVTRVRKGPVTATFDLGQITRALRDFVHCQEAGDWSGAAEILERRIAPLLPGWRELFHAHAAALEEPGRDASRGEAAG